MKEIIFIIILIVVVWLVVNLFSSDNWLPTYYPNPSDLTVYSNGPMFETLEQCQDWINSEATRRGQSPGEYDYECGLNCKLDDAYGLFICEDTVR